MCDRLTSEALAALRKRWPKGSLVLVEATIAEVADCGRVAVSIKAAGCTASVVVTPGALNKPTYTLGGGPAPEVKKAPEPWELVAAPGLAILVQSTISDTGGSISQGTVQVVALDGKTACIKTASGLHLIDRTLLRHYMQFSVS